MVVQRRSQGCSRNNKNTNTNSDQNSVVINNGVFNHEHSLQQQQMPTSAVYGQINIPLLNTSGTNRIAGHQQQQQLQLQTSSYYPQHLHYHLQPVLGAQYGAGLFDPRDNSILGKVPTSSTTTVVVVDDADQLMEHHHHQLSPPFITTFHPLSSQAQVLDNLSSSSASSCGIELTGGYAIGAVQGGGGPAHTGDGSPLSNASTVHCYDTGQSSSSAYLTTPPLLGEHEHGHVTYHLLDGPIATGVGTSSYLTDTSGSYEHASTTYPNSAYYQHYQPSVPSSQSSQSPPLQSHGQTGAGATAASAVGSISSAMEQETSGDAATNGGRYSTQRQQQQRQPRQQNSQHQQRHQESMSPDISVDEDGTNPHALAHTARTPPETIDWLKANYETHEGSSLPRCTLYAHYQDHCAGANLSPVNAASFGKLIRSVFKRLRTRRLGTRGNSKYHYNGIRIKPTSVLAASVSQEEFQRMNPAIGTAAVAATGRDASQRELHGSRGNNPRRISGSLSGGGRGRRVGGTGCGGGGTSSSSADEQTLGGMVTQLSPGLGQYQLRGGRTSAGESCYSNGTAGLVPNSPTPATQLMQQCMGNKNAHVPHVPIPSLTELEEYLLPLGYTIQHVIKFVDAYKANCSDVLECVKQLQFDMVERVLAGFWQQCTRADEIRQMDEELMPNQMAAVALDQMHIFRLCTLPQIQKFVEAMDIAFYQLLLDLLIPDVLAPMSTTRVDLNAQIRTFARNLEPWMSNAMGPGVPSAVKGGKLARVRLLAHALLRQTSLMHLVDVARAVFNDSDVLDQMHHDFCKVNFDVVHNQVDWVCCDCDGDLIIDLEATFRENLQQHRSLGDWIAWLDSVADRLLFAKQHNNSDNRLLEQHAKSYLLKWNFYNSMILRDVALQSADSFSTFHIVRLLFDEYMFHAVEARLGKRTGQPQISVMALPSSQQQQSQQQNRQFTACAQSPYLNGGGSSISQQQHQQLQQNHQLQLQTTASATAFHAYYPTQNTQSQSYHHHQEQEKASISYQMAQNHLHLMPIHSSPPPSSSSATYSVQQQQHGRGYVVVTSALVPCQSVSQQQMSQQPTPTSATPTSALASSPPPLMRQTTGGMISYVLEQSPPPVPHPKYALPPSNSHQMGNILDEDMLIETNDEEDEEHSGDDSSARMGSSSLIESHHSRNINNNGPGRREIDHDGVDMGLMDEFMERVEQEDVGKLHQQQALEVVDFLSPEGVERDETGGFVADGREELLDQHDTTGGGATEDSVVDHRCLNLNVKREIEMDLQEDDQQRKNGH